MGFSYEARWLLQGASPPQDVRKSLSFTVPFGFALEQFFTPRISMVVGARAPLFEYRSTKFGDADAYTTVGANFNATQLDASVFFYTD